MLWQELRFRIFRNIGNAFVKLGQFQDAVDSYESIMTGSAGSGRLRLWTRSFLDLTHRLAPPLACIPHASATDMQTAFNLMLCLFARGDKDKMKRHFLKMLQIPVAGATGEEVRAAANVPPPSNATNAVPSHSRPLILLYSCLYRRRRKKRRTATGCRS